jgi:para-nitrobenzyl esterase
MEFNTRLFRTVLFALLAAMTPATRALAADQVTLDTGVVQGEPGRVPGIRVFEGIPYAAPPVGDLRWKAPQPVAHWEGVRTATQFGPRPMQEHKYADMIFRDTGPSEDCLYLNVWTPAKSAAEKLPVMVWIYGGGFEAGATSEPRQDGTHLAGKGVVVVSMNYRLGVFGFFAHPWLTAEAAGAAVGNYGIMDQAAALRWVQRNIAAFGGDPGNVTIFGESAGSYSVSLLMASPDTQGLFQKAIGESGSIIGTRRQPNERNTRIYTLAQAETWGLKFVGSTGAKSLAELRAIPAAQLLTDSKGATYKEKGRDPAIVVDGHFMPEDPYAIYTEGRQAHVPLLAGWTADENRAAFVFGNRRPTAASFEASVRRLYPGFADELLKVYSAPTEEGVVRSAGDMACDGFIVASVRNWILKHQATGGSPVFVYQFDRAVPVAPGTTLNGSPAASTDIGANHASDIPYVFGSHSADSPAAWTPEDWTLSDAIATYWSNFAKTGVPSGGGLPEWPHYTPDTGYPVMHLDVHLRIEAQPESERARVAVWDTAHS